MVFKHPNLLWALVLVPVLFYLLFLHERRGAAWVSLAAFFPQRRTVRTRLQAAARGLLVLCLGMLVLAMARPQKGFIEETLHTEGIDIVLCIDISSSMKAEDFIPNRLGAAKAVAKEFIAGRGTDRIGMVVFGRSAITASPLTIDHGMLQDFIDDIHIGMIPDGTAIGNAIAESSRRLMGGGGESRVLILLTDGINNSGEIDPLTAASAAAAVGIKIYTIGVGSTGTAPYPVEDQVFGRRYVQVPVQIDEESLTAIAESTGGRYFRATNTEKLEEIYREIDLLEKSKIEIRQYRRTREWYTVPVVLGMILLVAHVLLYRAVLRPIP
ncbi:MAG: vWA domain-containing protein [Spirochaetota bacterium]